MNEDSGILFSEVQRFDRLLLVKLLTTSGAGESDSAGTAARTTPGATGECEPSISTAATCLSARGNLRSSQRASKPSADAIWIHPLWACQIRARQPGAGWLCEEAGHEP